MTLKTHKSYPLVNKYDHLIRATFVPSTNRCKSMVNYISSRMSALYNRADYDLPVTVRAYEAAGDIENESFDLSTLAVSPTTKESVTGMRIVPENREMKVAGCQWINGLCTKSTFSN